jgi:hypothetical protein
MSRNRVTLTFFGFPGFVNLWATILAVGLIVGNYWVSIGRLAGTA